VKTSTEGQQGDDEEEMSCLRSGKRSTFNAAFGDPAFGTPKLASRQWSAVGLIKLFSNPILPDLLVL